MLDVLGGCRSGEARPVAPATDWPILGYGVTEATMADVLLAGVVFGAWRRWGRFRGEQPTWY